MVLTRGFVNKYKASYDINISRNDVIDKLDTIKSLTYHYKQPKEWSNITILKYNYFRVGSGRAASYWNIYMYDVEILASKDLTTIEKIEYATLFIASFTIAVVACVGGFSIKGILLAAIIYLCITKLWKYIHFDSPLKTLDKAIKSII